MSTFEKMKLLKEKLGDEYFYYFGSMIMDGFSIEYSINYLYDAFF